MWWEIVVPLAAGLAVGWLALVVALHRIARRTGERTALADALRLVPDVVRLLRGLAADRTLPRPVRLRMYLLLGYLLMPVDLVPDFLPVVGYADDAVIAVLALRSVTRAAGARALDQHWPGTPAGLTALKRLAGVAD